jgi:hypothetical protein
MRHPVPPCDILLHGGDFTKTGHFSEFEEFSAYLASLTDVKYKIVIAGNHEVPLDPKFSYLGPNTRAAHLSKLNNCIYLEDSGVEVMGLKIYGSPWQPVHINNGFQLHRGSRIRAKWDLIPKDVDFLISNFIPK